MSVSLIITTFDWPQALRLVLRAVARQAPRPDEVIIADDGSAAETRQLLQQVAGDYPVPLRHVWQEHRGFRVGMARNRAVAAARGDYVIFLDGDMLPQRHFIADHRLWRWSRETASQAVCRRSPSPAPTKART